MPGKSTNALLQSSTLAGSIGRVAVPFTTTRFAVDANTGALVKNEDYADKPFLYRLHSGEAFGDGGLVVAMFWGLALAILSASGFYIYLTMRGKRELTGIRKVFW